MLVKVNGAAHLLNVEANITGSFLQGRDHATDAGLTCSDHARIEADSDSFRSLQRCQTPRLSVKLKGQGASVRDLGEPAICVAAPVLAKVIFADTGQRLREMPFSHAVGFV